MNPFKLGGRFNRQKQLGRLDARLHGRERLRRDADHGHRNVAHRNRAADDGGIGGEPAPPEPVAEQRHALVADFVLLLGEVAAD